MIPHWSCVRPLLLASAQSVTGSCRVKLHSAGFPNQLLCHPLHRPLSLHFQVLGEKVNLLDKRRILQPSGFSWSSWRTYAKKGKDKGGKGHKKMTLSSDQLAGVVDMDQVRSEFDHVLTGLREKFIHQLSVRTSQGVFDSLVVKTADGNFPLIQLGQVSQKSPQLLTINLSASPQYIPQVKQALADSGMNVNPQQDGTSLFIPLPKVTREHRENLAKNAKMLSEQAKKSLRDVYSKYARKIKSAKQGHSSDDLIAADDMVKDLMHSSSHQVEEMTTAKQKELLGGK